MEVIKKISNATRENTYTLKILETPKYLVLNDQFYDKTDLNPVKFEILDANDITFTSWIFVLKRFIFTNYRNTNRFYEQLVKVQNYGMVEDIQYPGRFYITGQRTTCSGFLKILQEKTDPNTGKNLLQLLTQFNHEEYASFTVAGNGCGNSCGTANFYAGGYSIVHQEREYLIIRQNWANAWGRNNWFASGWHWGYASSGNRCNIFKLNKSDLSTVAIHDSGDIVGDVSYNYFYMEHNGRHDYIFINYNLNHYILKYNPDTNTTATIYSNEETGCNITCNPVKIGDYYYYLVDEYKRTGNYGYQLCKVKINYSYEASGTCEHEYINIEDNHKMDVDRSAVMANVTHPLIHECHTLHTPDNKDYIIVVARSQPNGEWYSPQHKLVVLRIEEDKAVITQVVEFRAFPCRGMLTYYEEPGYADVIITLHSSCFKIWKFDYEQEKYIDTFTKNGIFYGIGIDEQQRVYVQDSANGIQMFDKIETSIAKVYFKENIINEDDDVAHICFWTKNYFNEYTSERVIINLYHGITFEDGTIEKEFITSSSGPSEISVLINTQYSVKAQATIAVISKTS